MDTGIKAQECAEAVLKWAIDQAMRERCDYLKAQCGESARQAAAKTWKESNPDDGVGGFSTNPYERNKEYLLKNIEQASARFQKAQAICEFVQKRICQQIPEETR